MYVIQRSVSSLCRAISAQGSTYKRHVSGELEHTRMKTEAALPEEVLSEVEEKT